MSEVEGVEGGVEAVDGGVVDLVGGEGGVDDHCQLFGFFLVGDNEFVLGEGDGLVVGGDVGLVAAGGQ